MITMRNNYRLLTFAVAVLALSFLAFPVSALAASPVEQQRIDLLLGAIGEQTSLTFIRNGSEYTAEDAVNHLKRKMRSAGDRITTAEEFIDHLATASSFSGKPYLIRQPGKEAEPAGPYLHRLLLEVAPRQATVSRRQVVKNLWGFQRVWFMSIALITTSSLRTQAMTATL